jgi:hypothetical protein
MPEISLDQWKRIFLNEIQNFKPISIFLFLIINKAIALDGIDELRKQVNSPRLL